MKKYINSFFPILTGLLFFSPYAFCQTAPAQQESTLRFLKTPAGRVQILLCLEQKPCEGLGNITGYELSNNQMHPGFNKGLGYGIVGVQSIGLFFTSVMSATVGSAGAAAGETSLLGGAIGAIIPAGAIGAVQAVIEHANGFHDLRKAAFEEKFLEAARLFQNPKIKGVTVPLGDHGFAYGLTLHNHAQAMEDLEKLMASLPRDKAFLKSDSVSASEPKSSSAPRAF